MTVDEASKKIMATLGDIYEPGEASAIRDWVLESLTGKNKSEHSLLREKHLDDKQTKRLHEILPRLEQHEPLQYILNESWFCGLKFYVDKNVLIPRPETEELVEWIISNCKFPIDELSILDIGSGSGCIAITLKRRIRKAKVYSIDKSEAALDIARSNASRLGADVTFIQMDFLNPAQRDQLPSFDIIVSNPPYIPLSDQKTMDPNVLNFEPHEALFVPDNDALIFYRAMADFGKKKLNPQGTIYAELHENAAKDVSRLFNENGYKIDIKKDMQGKERMMRANIEPVR